MSTTDPVAERRRREAARRGSPTTAVGLVVTGALTAIGAGLVAATLLAFASIGDFTEAPLFPWPALGLALGIPALVVGSIVHSGLARRFTGRALEYPVVGPLTIQLLGAAIGAWVGWLAPVAGPPGGVWWLVPVGLTALALLTLVTGIRGRLGKRAARESLAAQLATGRITAGEVTAIPEIGPDSGGLLGEIVVRFVDDAGTERWVQRLGQWKRHELPKTGDTVAVLFDPAAPGDTKRIWIGPADSRTVEDFSRWSL